MRCTTLILSCALFVHGCTMAPEPELPVPPPPVPEAFTPETISAPYCPIDRVEVTLLPRSEARPTLASKPLPGVKNGSKPVAPVQLVQEAQKAARVEPSARGYVGQRGRACLPGRLGRSIRCI